MPDRDYDSLIIKLLPDLPNFLPDFEKSLSGKSPATRYTYLHEIGAFLSYLIETDLKYASLLPKNMPLSSVSERTREDLQKYADSLKCSEQVKRKKLTALSIFYQHLVSLEKIKENPVDQISVKRTLQVSSDPEVINDEEIDRLILGVRLNQKYLHKGRTEDGKPYMTVFPIRKNLVFGRERNIKRNSTILSLILSEGLSADEVSGLNVGNADLSEKTIHAAGRTVPLSLRSYELLKDYLTNKPLPKRISDKYKKAEIYAFCRAHMDQANFRDLAARHFYTYEDGFLSDMETIAKTYRTSGRFAYPKNEGSTHALFLSRRGDRLTMNAIQKMLSEMIRTYLPEKADSVTASLLRKDKRNRLLRAGNDDALSSLSYNRNYLRQLKAAAKKTSS